MRRTNWAVAAAAVAVLGAAGCDAGGAKDPAAGASAGSPSATGAPESVPPRPKGTGPLAKDVVRADIEGSAADAGVPANAPEYGEGFGDGPPDSPMSCAVAFKGFGTKDATVDIGRYEVVVDELAERGWRYSGKGRGHEAKDGVVWAAQEMFKQRGWTLVAEYRPAQDDGVITLMAFEDACAKRTGMGVGGNPLG
ncbi:hypothetical protein ACFVDH_21855 [Streptomyces sp. NPDC057674]|uniref:hypothetical protein n=1 Tax=Streptomyces sp. NPDC057674 TaxID=3346203 RepID=UPI0036BAF710